MEVENIIWEGKKINTGISIIDKHHTKFIELVKYITNSINNSVCDSQVPHVFHKLVFFAENYFVEEEIFLNLHNYPKLQLHKESHKRFVDKISYFQGEYYKGKFICRDMLKYIKEWFGAHILKSDNEAVKFLLSKKNK